MNLKAFETLVLRDPSRKSPKIRQLQDMDDRQTRQEVEHIIDSHQRLWQFEVYVDPEYIEISPTNERAVLLSDVISGIVGLQNELPEFQEPSTHDLNTVELELSKKAAIRLLGLEDKVSLKEAQELNMAAVQRSMDGTTTILDHMISLLRKKYGDRQLQEGKDISS
jgi:hypothetical protein